MKNFLPIIFAFYISAVISEELTSNDIYLKDNLYYLKSTNTIFTGSVVGQFNGKIIDGKKEGFWKNHHQNGKVASTGNYFDGKQIGKWQFFQISGRIWREGEIKNNKQHGHWTSYFNNGNIETTGYYINGEWDGVWEYFDRKSNILERITYAKGVRTGEYTSFYLNGNVKLNGNFENNQKTGFWKKYHANGNLAYKGLFKHKVYAGSWIVKYDNGQECATTDDAEKIDFTFYDTNGEIKKFPNILKNIANISDKYVYIEMSKEESEFLKKCPLTRF